MRSIQKLLSLLILDCPFMCVDQICAFKYGNETGHLYFDIPCAQHVSPSKQPERTLQVEEVNEWV